MNASRDHKYFWGQVLKQMSLETLEELNSTDYVAKQTEKMMGSMLENTVTLCIMGGCVWFCGWVQAAGLMTVANRLGLDDRWVWSHVL